MNKAWNVYRKTFGRSGKEKFEKKKTTTIASIASLKIEIHHQKAFLDC